MLYDQKFFKCLKFVNINKSSLLTSGKSAAGVWRSIHKGRPLCAHWTVLPDRVDDFQPKSSPKPAHFNKNQPKILTAKIMLYDFITMSIKINKDHFYLLKIK